MENPFVNLKQYLASDLQELSREPVKLRKTLAQLENDKAEELAKNYTLAIDSRVSLDESVALVETLKTTLKKELSNNIDSSEAELKHVRQMWSQLDEKKAQLNAIRHYSNHLQDLCDLPKLTSALISLKNFQGALDILKRMKLLQSNYKEARGSDTGGSLLEMIYSGVEAEVDKMADELIRRLKEDLLKLPECMQILDYLAQTGWFPTQHLQYILLVSRLSSFEARLNIAPEVETGKKKAFPNYSDDPGRQLKRRLDLTLNFATELSYFYRACFPHSAEMDTTRSLYYSSLHAKLIRPLLENFREKLPLVTQPSHISSLLNHSMFVGASLSNVGLDLRQLLAPIFEKCILESFSAQFSAASKALNQSFRSALRLRQDLASISAKMAHPVPASSGPLYHQLLDRVASQDFSPPLELKQFPSLAQYANDMLHHFNSLRTLAVLTIASPMLSYLLECLKDIGRLLVSIKPSEELPHSPEFEAWTYVINSLFLDTLIPYLGSVMILAIFGGTHVFKSSNDKAQPQETLEDLLQIQEFRNLFKFPENSPKS